MAKIKYRDVKLGKKSFEVLDVINGIIDTYRHQGYVLTLRQLYYQLVSRDLIANKDSQYAKVGRLLKEGRLGGIVDWDAIEDRLRSPSSPPSFSSPSKALDLITSIYERPRQEGQSEYVEVWVEKDALSGVLSRVTRKYHIPIMVNRGYSSITAMHESFKRFFAAYERGQNVTVLYLGDFDPSGLDMIRDIRDRTLMFADGKGSNWSSWERDAFTVKPIALTIEQIKQYSPPPNPAKVTDSRAKKYIKEYGNTSWEVDALPPKVLDDLLDDAIRDIIDINKYDISVNKEHGEREKLDFLHNYL